jgi:DNA invertase Pin-like site-specific DNA recombinase
VCYGALCREHIADYDRRNPRVIGDENREAIERFFREHLCATQRECAEALGLSDMAVNRHVKAIRAGWRGQP